ncbi:MAG: hypothetical protein C4532_11395 [Candidatus Abyssobacteria bacterium SURF_17]|uniref:Glycosyltransferase RgtA/B/C/D-like domain-containing protein n=1 Tax=Candidatus Abyssobacteria bacterium SURF_17 TaxID=2093361 RepID=A0A419EWY6_9BACT|nr:MAG: hypothetical protein C4532_11395 [Candidatus Abyssubacteria bacterium SURF_17]
MKIIQMGPLSAVKQADDSPGSTSPQLYIPLKLGILLFLFTFLLFANTLDQYFLLDDFLHIGSAKYNTLPHTLLGYDTNLETKFFRPVSMFFFWVLGKLFGVNPVAYNVAVLFLFASAAVLATNLFYLLFQNLTVAAVFGFVFIAFPNHAEVIDWPCMHALWALSFYMATLNLFAYYRLSLRPGLYAFSLLMFLGAVLSKEEAFTLPVSLVLLDFFLYVSRNVKLRFSKRAVEHCAYFGLLALVLVITRSVFNTGIGYSSGEGVDYVSLYLQNIHILIIDLLQIYLQGWVYLIAPISPAILYQKHIILLVFITFAVMSIILARQRRLDVIALSYCILFVTVALLPALGTFRLFRLAHWSRFLYLPSVGACYIIAMLLGGMLVNGKSVLTRYGFFSVVMLLMVCLTKYYDRTWIRSQDLSEKVIQATVNELREYPQYSRVYVSGIPSEYGGVPCIGGAFKAAIGLYYDRNLVEASMDYLPEDNILVLERENYAPQDWRYVWLTWDTGAEAIRTERPIQPNQAEEPPLIYDFMDRRSQGTIEAANDLAQVYAPNTPYPIFMVNGSWSLLKLPPLDPKSSIQYCTVEMMLKNEEVEKDIARIFWVTENDLDYSGTKSIGFYVTSDGNFHEYRIPLYRNGLSLINPRIIRLAIRPSQKSGALFSVKKMTLEYY